MRTRLAASVGGVATGFRPGLSSAGRDGAAGYSRRERRIRVAATEFGYASANLTPTQTATSGAKCATAVGAGEPWVVLRIVHVATVRSGGRDSPWQSPRLIP